MNWATGAGRPPLADDVPAHGRVTWFERHTGLLRGTGDERVLVVVTSGSCGSLAPAGVAIGSPVFVHGQGSPEAALAPAMAQEREQPFLSHREYMSKQSLLPSILLSCP